MRSLSFAFFSTLAFLPAQQDAATAAPAVTPHVIVDSVGPDGWRMRLGPTNLGSLLASEKGRALWEPLVQPLHDAWRGMAGDEDYAASLARWTGYSGQVRVGIWVDPATARMSDVHSRVVGVVLHGDGRTDLQALAADIRLMLYRSMPGEWTDREIDGKSYRVRVRGDEYAFEPLVLADRVQLLLVDDGDPAGAMADFRPFAAATPAALRPDSPAMTTRVDFPRIMAVILANDSNDAPLMKALGLASLGTSVATVGTAGPRLHLSTTQAFPDAPCGLFAAALPPATAPSDLEDLVPADAALWKVGRFDVKVMFETVIDAIVAADFGKRDEIDKGMREETGIDVVDDLLVHLTDEVMFSLGEAPADDEEPGEWFPDRTNWMLVWKLRDTAKFAAGLEELLKHAKPFLSREATREDGEAKFHRYGNMASYDLWLTTGNGLFGIAGGTEAEEHLVALQQRAGGKAPKGGAPAAKDFAMLQRWLPANAYGRGFGHPSWLTAGPAELWLQIWHELLPLPRGAWPDTTGDEDSRAAVRALLREHQLDRVFTATGQDKGTWTFSIYW